MLGFVKEAFEKEKQKQEDLGLHCEVTIVPMAAPLLLKMLSVVKILRSNLE